MFRISKLLLIGQFIVYCCFILSDSSAQSDDAFKFISIEGAAIEELVPDSFIVYFKVQEHAEFDRQSKERHVTPLDTVEANVFRIISGYTLTLSGIGRSPGSRAQLFKQYKIVLMEEEDVINVMELLELPGVDEITVQKVYNNLNEIDRDICDQAIKEAKLRAERYAKGVNKRVGNVLGIRTVHQPYEWVNSKSFGKSILEPQREYSLEPDHLKCVMTVSYELLD